MVSIETRGHINFTDEGVTTTFNEGDNVICCVGDEERHIGKITAIGSWKENEDAEPYQVICIDTSKSAKSYSSEIIKVDDITYICKNPLADNIEPPMSKKEADKKTYVSMLVGLGYDKALVEKAWTSMEKVMDCFDIPVDKALACSLYSIANKCSIYKPLKDICGVDIKEMEKLLNNLESAATFSMGMAIKSFGDLLESIGKVIKGENTPTMGEVMNMVSSKWCNMTDDEKKTVTELFASVDENTTK